MHVERTCIIHYRSGAFECYPEMMRYRGHHGSPLHSTLSRDLEDSEPPAVLYTADQPMQPGSELEDSSSDSEDNFYSNEREEFDDIYDWEYLEPSHRELRQFDEEQIRTGLSGTTSLSTAPRMATATSEVHAHRDRLRRLDYDSTYLDYTAATRSLSTVSAETSENKNETENSSGLLGTLSSLWSSAWGRSSSS